MEGRDSTWEEAAGTCPCLQRVARQHAGWCESAYPGLLGQGERTGGEEDGVLFHASMQSFSVIQTAENHAVGLQKSG